MNEYIKAFKNYAIFTGRATRKEYWMFMLYNITICLGLLFLSMSGYQTLVKIGVWAFIIYRIIIIIPAISITVRRLHDSGKSGWWYLIAFVPCIGLIIYVFMLRKSDVGLNRYDNITPYYVPE